MEKKLFLRKLAVFVVIVLAIVSLGLPSGCKQKSGPRVVGTEAPVPAVGFPRSFADLAEKIQPAVVNISTVSAVNSS